MEVRRLHPDEWRSYRSVRLESLRDSPSAFGSTAEEEASLTDKAWQRRLANRVQFVAEDGGMAIGTVGVLDEGDGITEVVSMWVAPHHRGQSVGAALVEAAVTAADEAGAKTMRLWVAEGNKPAETLYERCGFRRTGRSQRVRDDDPNDQRLESELERRLVE